MTRLGFVAGLVTVCALGLSLQASSQSRPPAPPKRAPDACCNCRLPRPRRVLREPFKGVTANGQIEPGLFAIRSTGVSTAPVREAAETFLAGLTRRSARRRSLR